LSPAAVPALSNAVSTVKSMVTESVPLVRTTLDLVPAVLRSTVAE
jgi:hypothetical protein